ncbi:MAG: UbiA family prenyltransferase [Nitrososphaerota archaeon]|nr:UbiA family prenyltransferase [Nitrososphaerota archaeon]
MARSRISRASVYTFSTLAGILIATRWNASPTILLLAPLSTFLISLSVYVLNDLFDMEVDRINAPNRPLARQLVSRREALVFVLILNFVGAGIGFALGPLTFAIALCEIVLGLLYSLRPFNLKDRFIVKTLSIGAGGVLANLFGGVASGVVNLDLIFCSAMFLVFLFSTSPLNDLADYVGDKAQNRKTIPIVIGPSRTLRLSIVASLLPLASALIFFRLLSFNPLTIIFLSILAARALQLLLPLERSNAEPATVRKQHKKMVYLHFLLQGALVVGSLAL